MGTIFIVYIYVFDCLWENNTKKIVCQNAWAEIRSPNPRMLKNQFWEFETKCRFLEKWFPYQGEQAHSLKNENSNLNPNPNQIKSFFCFCFFLCLQGQPELHGSYYLLQSCFSFFVRIHGKPVTFGSCIILQSCSSFLFRLHSQTELFASDHLLQS